MARIRTLEELRAGNVSPDQFTPDELENARVERDAEIRQQAAQRRADFDNLNAEQQRPLRRPVPAQPIAGRSGMPNGQPTHSGSRSQVPPEPDSRK